jgi:hypothetical protein
MKSTKSKSQELNKLVTSFTVFKFIKDMTTDFEDMKWYAKGYIDANGNYLKDNDDISAYDRLIINLKKLILMIPNPSVKSRLSNLTTAMAFYAEEIDRLGGDSRFVISEIFEYMNDFGVDLNELLKEEAMGGMSVGGGFIEGMPDATPANQTSGPVWGTEIPQKSKERKRRAKMIRRFNNLYRRNNAN